MRLLTPLPPTWYGLLWDWMQEVPEANLDDYGPRSKRDFEVEMSRRALHERSWGVALADRPVGMVGYWPMVPRLGQLHGICFTRDVWGTGLARAALVAVLHGLARDGVEKVNATYFSDNRRVHRFLASLGAVVEGRLAAHTLRRGTPIDMTLVALFAPFAER